MSTKHRMMDTSLTLDRLDIGTVGGRGGMCLPGSMLRDKSAPTASHAHLNGCVPLSHQVAGHKYGVDKVGILQHPDGTVLKQLQPPPRGPREMQFYSMVFSEGSEDPCLLKLQRYLPKYFGTWSSPDTPTELYLRLEDVTRGFRKPCIMDVKIGQRSYDPLATQEKRQQQIRKYPLMERIGFLLLGMRVYQLDSDSFDTYDQHYGRRLDQDSVKEGLSKFFHNGRWLRKDALARCLLKVRHILQWFQEQTHFNFYASSLLFVYEGATSTPLTSLSTATTIKTTNTSCTISPTITEGASKTAGSQAGGVEGGVNGVRGVVKGVLECNNNIELSLSTMYSLHQQACTCPHHTNTTTTTPDNGGWSCAAAVAQQQPNGNLDPRPPEKRNPKEREREQGGEEQGVGREGEEVGRGRMSEEAAGGGDGAKDGEVDVRMIDFAHVFPSQSPDEGYIYGLKNLLCVLQDILEE